LNDLRITNYVLRPSSFVLRFGVQR